ncbi:InlB B-repeat-containing protein [Bacillus marasmi]|uniref:InlB B-repeat-containing protein n=1 Tax=Bacillus marasmi TaxID=1926279 RepID=UPI0011CBC8F2|nr:Ig-like domain repeat protein [Bacillus marasmi]
MRRKRSYKKRSKRSWLAIVLAILLVAYNVPIGVLGNVFAESGDDQQIETTEPVNAEEENTESGAENTEPEVTEETEEPVEPADPEETEDPVEQEEPEEPVIETHKVTVQKSGEGSGTVSINGTSYSGSAIVVPEGPVEIVVTPAASSKLKSIKKGLNTTIPFVEDRENGNYKATIDSVTNDVTIRVEFELKEYQMTFSGYSHGRVVNHSGQTVGTNGGTESIEHGTDYTFTVSPNEGYHPVVTIDGKDTTELDDVTVTALSGGKFKYTINNVKNVHSIEAKFVINTYVLTFDYDSSQGAVEKGSVQDGIVEESPTADTIIANGGTVKVEHGKRPSFKVTPIEGYHIKSIKFGGDYISLPNDVKEKTLSYEFAVPEVNSDKTVTVIFEINTYQLRVNDPNNGDVSLDRSSVEHGQNAVVTIKPKTDYKVTKLTVNGTPVDLDNDANFTINDSNNSASFAVKNIQRDTNIVVTIERIQEVTGPWQNYVSIETLVGTKVAQIDDNKLIYSKDAKLNIKPLDNEIISFDFLSLSITDILNDLPGPWGTNHTLIENSIIERLQLKDRQRNNPLIVKPEQDLYLLFDRKEPAIENLKLEGDNKATVDGKVWYSGNVKVVFDLNNQKESYKGIDFSTDIDKVYYSKDDEAAIELPIAADSSYKFDLVNGNFQNNYKVWALDKAGNKAETKATDVNIDQAVPTLDGAVEVKQTGSEILNNLFFGMFFKEKIEVTVKAIDAASGIKDIKLIAKQDNKADKIISGDIRKSNSDRKADVTFTLDEENFDGKFAIEVTDHVNNTKTYDLTADNLDPKGNGRFIIDHKAPTVELTVTPDKENEQPYVVEDESNDTVTEFYSQDVELGIKVEDEASGIHSVKINHGDETLESYDFTDGTKEQLKPTIEPIHTSTLVEKGRLHDFTIAVKDNSGNKNNVEQTRKTIYIDENAPTLAGGKNAVTFEVENDSKFAEILNYLTFGTFFNKQIAITVHGEDDAAGIKEMNLVAIPGEDQDEPNLVRESYEESGLTAEAKYTLDGDYFQGTFNVEITDNIGNKSVTLVNAEHSNMEDTDSGIVMIEKNEPVPSIIIEPQADVVPYVDESDVHFYSGDVHYTVGVEDADSGVNAVQIDVNGDVVNVEDDEDASAASYYYHNKDQATLSTDDIEVLESNNFNINKDGSYKIRVDAIDNAGNVGHDDKTIFIDRTSPTITDFKFAEQNGKDGLQEAIEIMDYGFYFKEPIQVTIGAEDPDVVDDFEATSKVKEMWIYLQDYENGKFYGVENGELKEIAGANAVKAIPTSGELKFTVPAAFKGQIFAKATDFVDNTGEYVTPEGAVIEDEDKHKEETHIDFKKAETSYKDNGDVELYNKNVDVDLTVTDTYSGLKEIQWSIVAPHDTANNQSGIIKINNDKTYGEGSNPDGWQQTKTDRNLVTEMKKTLTVSNNSNDIVVKVKITDRSGNTSEDEIKFSIDKTTPTMNVTYDNNTADGQFADFYKENRTATIVITERNFKPEDVVHVITNTDGVIPKLVGWSTKPNGNDPDKTTHTATVQYTADGDYTFDLKYTDNAGNNAAPFAQHKFTLDKTKPVIQVTYNNSAAANGNYYMKARTATITITEHNFETSRIKIAGSASDNGAGTAFPGASGWSTKGDVHTATINYSADGKYNFDIDYTDKAGNIAADYKADEFIVDQTAPKLEITGVADKSANNGDVAPVVTYSDTNFNKSAVSIKLTGANHGPVDLKGSAGDAPNGGVFTFSNFEKKKENDDLYTLTAKLVDFAGNETTQTIQFSVNRFGSVYVFDDSLKSIDGKYVRQEMDVILTETNVDRLKHDSILVKMTKNGTPTDLVEGKDYTVSSTGGNGSWSQYKYVVKKELFAGDGRYTVALYSEDLAGNINENIDETKKAEISFGVDKTAPVIVPIDIESGAQYPVDTKSVTFSVKDNLVLDGAKVLLNNEEIDYKVDGENYTFAVPSSNSKQDVKVIAVDAAGNKFTKSVDDFLVSTNLFVRWYNNTPLFLGSIGGIGGIGAIIATASVVLNKKRRKLEVEE